MDYMIAPKKVLQCCNNNKAIQNVSACEKFKRISFGHAKHRQGQKNLNAKKMHP